MRTRLVVVLLLICGTLAGVFAANIVIGSGSTLTQQVTETRHLTHLYRGRVSSSHPTRSFTFSVPDTATIHARLRWGNGRARLREALLQGDTTLSPVDVALSARREIRDYAGVKAGDHAVRVTSLHGRSHFRVVVRVAWTVTVTVSADATSPTPSPSPDSSTGSAGSPTGSTGSSSGTQSGSTVQTPPPVWAAAFMDSTQAQVSESQALTQARTFNVIVATKGMYRPWVSEMKAANPHLLLLVYLNGTFSMNDSGSNYPSTWYERDANGNKIKSVAFGNYLMDVSNAGWISDVQARCSTFKAVSGYDGCFLDTLGVAPLNPAYVTGLPINLATGTTWTKHDWLNATEHIAASSGSVISPAPVFGNGIANGMRYFATDGGATERLLDGARGAMVELFMRPPNTSVTSYEQESQWLEEIQMLQDSASRNGILLTITKVWTSATEAQKDSWHRFALSSFLLGYTPGLDWFSFRYDHTAQYDCQYWNAKIGTPTNTFAKTDGAYQRSFTNGRVLVNPTTSSVTVPLGSGSWTDLEGRAVSGSITLAPHTGEVLTNA